MPDATVDTAKIIFKPDARTKGPTNTNYPFAHTVYLHTCELIFLYTPLAYSLQQTTSYCLLAFFYPRFKV